MRPLLLLMLMPLAIIGCGEDRESSGSDEAAIFRTVKEANDALAEGDYPRTCSYYSPAIRRELATQTQVESCPEAWAAINAALRRSLSPSQFDALTSYGIQSAQVEGDTATGTYGEPPESIDDQFGNVAGATIQLRKVDDRWLITSLPAR